MALSLPALPQPRTHYLAPCGPRDDVLALLQGRAGEVPLARGLDRRGLVMEVLISRRGGWSVIVTDTNDRTCLLASGTALEFLPAPPVGEGS